MDRLNLKQMSILLGIQIREIGRTFIGNNTHFEPFMDTLFFLSDDNTMIQLFRANQDGLHFQISSSKHQPVIDPEFEIEPEDKIVSKKIEIKYLKFPLEIKSITELWAGLRGKEFLVGFILYGKNREPLLSICTETDEIELIDYNTFRQRIENLPFDYGTLSTHWYQQN